MGFILLIAAAILYFAGPWFDGQETIGIILAIAGVLAIVVQFVWTAIVANQIRKTHKSINDRWGSF